MYHLHQYHTSEGYLSHGVSHLHKPMSHGMYPGCDIPLLGVTPYQHPPDVMTVFPYFKRKAVQPAAALKPG